MGEFTIIESPTNEALALRAQQGCRASFAELVARFQVPLLHFLLQRTRSLHDAEDLTQDVFVRAFRSLRRYESKWRFSTWIYTIAHRLSLNARRRWRPTIDSRALEALSSAGPLPEASLAGVEESGKLWRAAAAVLTAEQLTAMWLFYVEELPLEEIARVLGRSAGAAKGLLFRGRRKLAESLDIAWISPDAREAADAQRRAAIREGSSAVERTRIKVLPPRLATELFDG
jgi:RNA polymerase sigma-70 factor, ECF subfamily